VYRSKNKAIYVPFALRTRERRVDQKALLDSGATECFIHPRTVKRLNITTKKLQNPRNVRNVDGTPNKAGKITEAAELVTDHSGVKTKHIFFVADIGPDDYILGFPFLEANEPTVDWAHALVEGSTTISTLDADKWTPPTKKSPRKKRIPLWVCSIPDWTPGDEVWQRFDIRKSTMAQQLTIEVNEQKEEKTWQELVPPQYHRHARVFREKDSEKFPDRRPWDHAIDLKPDAPASINCRVYPLSPKEREEQKKFLATNLQLKRVRRSKSPYASGFFFIKKKDGKLRPVQDYRNLNKWTVPNRYPLLLISELIHRISGKKWFTKFDVRWGYNNVHIKEGDEWKAAFKTSDGLFEPTVMFFGLTNSPATFQMMVDDELMDLIDLGEGSVYMDDIIIHTDGIEEEHKAIVHKWLTRLAKLNLFLKLEKCHFHQREVEYLRMIVGNGKVRMDPVKVQGITQWPTPSCVKDVCSFLGFCNFYRAFISDFSNIARPLNDLTCKNRQWHWSDECETAFQNLKKVCASEPVLKTPDWTKPFVMHTDASGYALGVVIAQEHEDGMHPIAFHSRSLLPAEKNYDVHDKELAGVVFGFKCGRSLFLGAKHPVKVLTDHKNLQYFREPQKVTSRQARWIEFLQDFDYTLEHIAGTTNTVADLLSRRKDLNKGVDSDLPCTLLPDHLFSPPSPLAINKTFLSDDLDIRREVLRSLHDSPAAGHPGIANTWELVREHYEGPRL